MSPTLPAADPELEIWERVFVPNPHRISPEQARYLLEVHFPQSDMDRINVLSARAREGTLTAEEKTELERYVHVGHLLSTLKVKVRGKLREAMDHS